MSGSTHSIGMHRVPQIKGHEVMAYLTYIIDHYDHLPAFTAFVHANRTAVHDNTPVNDNVHSLQSLKLDFVQNHGYASLRCSWMPGCPDGFRQFGKLYGEARVW